MARYHEIKAMEPLRQNYSPLALSDASHPGWIYFLGNEDETRITIGFTGNQKITKRVNSHRRNSPFGDSAYFLAAVKGDEECERRVQGYFNDEKITRPGYRTEVFRASQRLVDYIVWLRDFYYVVTDESDESSVDIPVFGYEMWGPDQQRAKSERRDPDLFVGVTPWRALPDRQLTQDDYYTPSELIERARTALGGPITLDPASHYIANKNVQATRFFSVSENGLVQPWSGDVWLNPPFSQWPLWSAKIVQEIDRVHSMIVLANSRTITARYFEPVIRASQAVVVLAGRYRFWGTDKDGSPSNGQVLLLMRGNVDRFGLAYEEIGSPFVSWQK